MAEHGVLPIPRDVWIVARGVNPHALERVIVLVIEIAREGRKGRKIGALFVVSDAEPVLELSRCLIIDPLAGQPDRIKHIDNPDLRETVEELDFLDGAFVVSHNGSYSRRAATSTPPRRESSCPSTWSAPT